MLRMAHRICDAKFFVPTFGSSSRDYSDVFNQMKTTIASSTVIDASNVASYFLANRGQWCRFGDFPFARPAMNNMFIEYERDDAQCGCLIESTVGLDSSGESITNSTFRFMMTVSGKLHLICQLAVITFLEATIVGASRYSYAAAESDRGHGVNLDRHIRNLVTIPLLTLSFMNCKNVTRRDATDELGPTAKWIRRQKAPTIRYHILDINPMKEVLRTEGGIAANGLKKALHICRGHFADCPNGLFGKPELAGRYWKPAALPFNSVLPF